MKSLLLLIVSGLVGCAQTQLTTPATIRSNAAHTTGGHLIINDSNDTTGLDVQVRASGVVFTGRPATNGNIVLAPGNVAGSGTVQILAPRVDASTLTLADASGTTTVKSLILKTFGGTEYFTITGGTDSTSPGLVRTHNLNPIGASDTIGFGVGSGSAYHFGYFEHADIRETDGTSSAIYAATNSSSAQHAIFAESINGTGEAIRANVRAGSTGDAIQALTNGGGGAAIRAIGNIISGLAGTYDIGAGIQDWFHVYAIHGDFRENDGLSSGVYATTNSASAQRAVFAEGINGTGDVIRANARAGSSGVALHAITNGGGGVAILASGGGITDDSMAGGGTQCVQVNNVGHLAGSGAVCSLTPGAWTPFIPSTITNLSSTVTDAEYTQHGKDVFFHLAILGTSNGSNPVISLPVTPHDTNLILAVYVCTGGVCVPGTYLPSTGVVSIYNNTAFTNTTIYTIGIGGVYDSN